MLKLAIAIFLISFGSAHAEPGSSQSYEPPPGGFNSGQPPKPQTESVQQRPAPDQRGTEVLPFFIKILPTPKTEEETKQTEREHDDKATTDWWIVRLTGVLAFIAFVQTLVFAYQGWQLRKTVGTIMTGERAWMNIRETLMRRPGSEFAPPSKDGARSAIAAVRAYNEGRTPAKIIRFATRMQIVDADYKFPDPPEFPKIEEVGGREIVVPEALFKNLVPLENGIIGLSEMEQIQSGKRLLVLYGFIEYEDTFGRCHKLGFGRAWHEPPTNKEKFRRFKRWGTEAYNYHT